MFIAMQFRMKLPPQVDAARMVAEQRVFEGELALTGMSRLGEELMDDSERARYRLEFCPGELGDAQLRVKVSATLPLQCQRTLETFACPVEVDTRLGLLQDESGIAGLPAEVQPLLLDDGMLSPVAVIEDELLLALPLVPVKPGSQPLWPEAEEMADVPEDDGENPFAVLGKLKHTH